MSVNTENRKNAFKKEALIHLDSLLRAANYMTGEETTSRNLVQETYLRAYCLWGNLSHSTGFKTRLFRAMTGLLYELYSTKNSTPASDGNGEDKSLTGGEFQSGLELTGDEIDNLCDKVGGDMIRNSIRELPFNLRLILILNFLEGFSYQEIAEITKMNIGAVKSSLAQGRQHLQRILWKKIVSEGLTADGLIMAESSGRPENMM